MIGEETAQEGAALISTAIAQMIEDAHEDAMAMPVGNPQALLRRAESLHAIGVDVATLAQAISVLARRGEPWIGKSPLSALPPAPTTSGGTTAALSAAAYAEAIERRRALRIPGYATLADVGMDGEWVSPLQKTAGSLTGPVLIALHWLEADAVEPNRAVLDELGYLPEINFNKVLNRALELAGLIRSDA